LTPASPVPEGDDVMKRAVPRALVGCTALALLVSACGFTDEPQTSPGPNPGSAIPNYLPIAEAAVAKAMAGTNRPVGDKPRPAVKGKKLGIVVTAEAIVSVGFPARAAKAAAETLGWQVTIFDANNQQDQYGARVQDAVTSGVDAIILVSIDCQKVKTPLDNAKARGIKIVSIYAFDCNDPLAGGEAQGKFDGVTNYGPAAANIDDFTKSYGADQANYIVAESKNTAKIIAINAPEYTVLNWTWAGFKETIEKSGGSSIVELVEISTPEVTNGGMVTKIQAALARHPEATWIKSPFTYVTTLGIDTVLNQQPRDIKVMGGEGYKEELDLMKKETPTVTAMNVIASEWTGWSAIDSLNSIFRNEPTVDSGLGWQLVDKTNLPTTDQYVPSVDFKAAYKKAWGV
jgi:ribose transport system substrate-binding protein